MALFLVLVPEPSSAGVYEAAVKREFPNDHLVVGPNAWMVSSAGISKDVSDKILPPPPSPDAPLLIVVAISGWYGFARNSLWEWLASKQSTSNGR